MTRYWISILFIFIGTAIGVILSLQIRANPVFVGSSTVEQFETQKALLSTFSMEQEALKKELTAIDEKIQASKSIIEKRVSTETLKELNRLKDIAGFNATQGNGVRIILNDNSAVNRFGFSLTNENFVQASDLRDLVNALFLQGAQAIQINGKRLTPLTTIQPVFDTILIDNLQVIAPFSVEAVGHSDTLVAAAESIKQRKIQVFVDKNINLSISPLDTMRSLKFLSASSL